MNPIVYFASKLSPTCYYKIERLRYKIPIVGSFLSILGNFIRNRDGVIPTGFARGFNFNVGDSIAGYLLGTVEPHVQAAIAQLVQPGMIAYDLGANVGFFSLILAKAVGTKGRVIAFEPVSKNATRIAYNAQLNDLANIVVRTEAISAADGAAAFEPGNFSTMGKLHNQTLTLSATAREIPVRSLDSLIAAGDILPPNFIKVDIEGAEVDCLHGAATTLRQMRPLLLIELHNTNDAIARLLSSAKYESLVLGSDQTIIKGHWNVQIVGYPSERPLAPAVRRMLTSPELTPWR
jgi:FkbM family methyltransferase